VGQKLLISGLSIQKNYMYATIAHLEGNQEKLSEYLARSRYWTNSMMLKISTLFDAN